VPSERRRERRDDIYPETVGEAKMGSELSGVSALVTGSTSGIGRAVAVALARKGAHVAVSGRDELRGKQVVDDIVAAGGQAVFLAADLSSAAAARSLADRAIEELGKVDILVNNAAIYPPGLTDMTTDADFDAVFAINVRAPFFLVARLAPEMVVRGHGTIVNVTSMVAHFGFVGMTLYGASKAALVLLTKAWAAEYGPHGVRVNAVSPGPTRTEGTAAYDDTLDDVASAAPARRAAAPEEIAEAVVFMATDRSSFVHGAVLPVDGGRTAV
jgi:NAD(P)-dependent dehydrogenase (short-subunit alcohol dehydrogenase family)